MRNTLKMNLVANGLEELKTMAMELRCELDAMKSSLGRIVDSIERYQESCQKLDSDEVIDGS